MPILYDEFGIESQIPLDKRQLYGGAEPKTTRPVPEAQQAAAYRRAIQLAYCQSNVAGMLLFHTHDEETRPGWQSGLVYADGTPKTSLEPVRQAIEAAGAGAIGLCPLVSTAVTAFVTTGRTIWLRCHRDCIYRARLVRLPLASPALSRSGRAPAGKRVKVTLSGRVAPGWYRLWVSLVHPTRPGKPLVRWSTPFAVRSSPRPASSPAAAAAMAPRFWLEP
jgi:hypothetical protein